MAPSSARMSMRPRRFDDGGQSIVVNSRPVLPLRADQQLSHEHPEMYRRLHHTSGAEALPHGNPPVIIFQRSADRGAVLGCWFSVVGSRFYVLRSTFGVLRSSFVVRGSSCAVL